MKILKTKEYSAMTHYEKEIVEFLHSKYNFTEKDAITTIEQYYPVMQRLGWYSSAEEWADNLNQIINEKHLSPEQWNEFINKYQKTMKIRQLDPAAIESSVPSTIPRKLRGKVKGKNVLISTGSFIPKLEGEVPVEVTRVGNDLILKVKELGGIKKNFSNQEQPKLITKRPSTTIGNLVNKDQN